MDRKNFIEKRNELEDLCSKNVLGKDYVDPKKYSVDGSLAPGKYPLQMFEKFYSRCKYCMNYGFCTMSSKSCFNRLFNDCDSSFFNYCIELVISEQITDFSEKSIKKLFSKWKTEKPECKIKCLEDEINALNANDIAKAINDMILADMLKNKIK